MLTSEKILVLAPHADDEICCAGFIQKIIQEGKEVKLVALANSNDSCQDHSEALAAWEILGIEDWTICEFHARNMKQDQREIGDYLYKIVRPDLVLMPSPGDVHQDHKAISEIAQAVFKYSSILFYEHFFNDSSFKPGLWVSLLDIYMERKLQALRCYGSQLFRRSLNEEAINSLAILRGGQCGSRYAEAFAVSRLKL